MAARLRIEVDDIWAHNPSVIYVRGSGYGNRGPDADAGGYDFLSYWARSGVASVLTGSDGVPFPPAPAYGDSLGAMTIAGGICAALLHRERTGEGHVVDVSLLATGMWAMGGALAISQLTGEQWSPVPRGINGTPSNPLVGFYRTQDDRHVTLSMLQGFHYWPDMRQRLGLDHLAEDERFSSPEQLMANAAAASDPQVTAIGYLQDLETADGTPFRLVATPVQFDGEPARPRRAPAFNEHGDAILTEELGLSWDDLVALKIQGAVT